MNIWSFFRAICIAAVSGALFLNCDNKQQAETTFTRADSLTETYLALQDTMLQVWNTMIHDDNRKITAMRHLLEELERLHPEKRDDLAGYFERVDDLRSMRYDQQSISDSELITEYDFASNSLVSDLVALAETQPEFSRNPEIQLLVDSIRAADQRVNNYRAEYDAIAGRFNRFLESNQDELEVLHDSSVDKKPLFQVAAE